MRNWKTGTNGTGAVYTTVHTPIPQFTDNTIFIDPSANKCATIVSAITTSFAL
jgi:hypothetical protein